MIARKLGNHLPTDLINSLIKPILMMITKFKDSSFGLPCIGAVVYEVPKKNIGYFANNFANNQYYQGHHDIAAL